jgi:hypothetical protein
LIGSFARIRRCNSWLFFIEFNGKLRESIHVFTVLTEKC